MNLIKLINGYNMDVREELMNCMPEELRDIANELLAEFIDSPKKFEHKYGTSLTEYTHIYIDSFNRTYDYMLISTKKYCKDYRLHVKEVYQPEWSERGPYTATAILRDVIHEVHCISSSMRYDFIEMVADFVAHRRALENIDRPVNFYETVSSAKEALMKGRTSRVGISVKAIIAEYFRHHAPNVYETAGGLLDILSVTNQLIIPMEAFDEWVDMELGRHRGFLDIYERMHPAFDTMDEFADVTYKHELVSMSYLAVEELAQELIINNPVEVFKGLHETCDPEGIENYLTEEMLPALGLLDIQTVILLDW